MPTPADLARTCPTGPISGASLDAAAAGQQTLADAARFAVLCRVAPMLRHDMAGALQPLGMVAMVLQRRVQAPEPDLPAIAKNAASIGSLTKEAAAGCIDAISWLAPREDPAVSLNRGVESVLKVLMVELSGVGLEAVNEVAPGTAGAPQGFFRTALAATLLAICDQPTVGGRVYISVSQDQASLVLRLALAQTTTETVITRTRRMEWQDVQAIATSLGTTLERNGGVVTLGLPVPCGA